MCVCYLELLKGIRVETVIISLSLTCHYCLFSSTACVSASTGVQTHAHAHTQTQACATAHKHTPAHTQRCFFWQFLCLMENTFYLALPEASPFLPLSLKCFHLLALFLSRSPLLSVLIVIAFFCGKSLKKTHNECTAQVKNNVTHVPLCQFS